MGAGWRLRSLDLLPATSWDGSAFDEEWLAGPFARFDMETGAIDTVASYDFRPPIPPGFEWDPIHAIGEVMVANGHPASVTDRPSS